MRKYVITLFGILLSLLPTSAQIINGNGRHYEGPTDARCLDLMGVPLEGPDSLFLPALESIGFERVVSEDDEPGDYYFRGDYFGIKGNLLITVDEDTRLLSTAIVTCGPYRTFGLFDQNHRYLLLKLQRQFGDFKAKGDGSLHLMTDQGYVRISNSMHDDKSRTIKVLYLNTTPYYKDAVNMGLKGRVQEVITENPVAENGIMHFDPLGQETGSSLIDRSYNITGYLQTAAMLEPTGAKSLLSYEYDELNRLVRRTLLNNEEGIRSINEYSYNDDDEIKQQTQKVFDKQNECILSITMKNNYTAHDDEGNWTRNELKLMYWEKGRQAQNLSVIQNRTISYWEEEE